MSRLIDADAIPYTMLYKENWLKRTGVEKPGVWKDTIDAMPTIEPERKIGEWNFVGNQMFECTSCGVAYTEYQFEKMRVRYNDPKFPRFCPNCGADMRKDGD